MDAGIVQNVLQYTVTQSRNALFRSQQCFHRNVFSDACNHAFKERKVETVFHRGNFFYAATVVDIIKFSFKSIDGAIHGYCKDEIRVIFKSDE